MSTIIIDIHIDRLRFLWFSCITVFFLEIHLHICLFLIRFNIVILIYLIFRFSLLCRQVAFLIFDWFYFWKFLWVIRINIWSVNAAENARADDYNWDNNNSRIPLLPDPPPPWFFFLFYLRISWNVFAFLSIFFVFAGIFFFFFLSFLFGVVVWHHFFFIILRSFLFLGWFFDNTVAHSNSRDLVFYIV